MKNSDAQKPKPLYPQESYYPVNNEVDLTDLAIILLRRSKIIASIASFVIVLGITTALLIPQSYTYSVSLEIGTQFIGGTTKPLEASETLLAKIQHVFIPQVLNEQRQTNPDNKEKYKIKTTIPKSSGIIILEIEGTEVESNLMTMLLHKVTKLSVQDHDLIYNAIKQNLASLKQQAINELNSLVSKKYNSTDQRRLLKDNIEAYETQLRNLRNTREILQPMRSIDATGMSKKLIFVITIVLSIFLSIFSALSAEFISKVKEKNNPANEINTIAP
jgi:uncharacterized protein involved in exopolysaccharide biosynthesis